MKKIIILCAALAVSGLQSCKTHTDHAALRKEVLGLHDELMNQDGKAMSIKMTLDSLKSDSAKRLGLQLDTLSSHMMDWMHSFKPDDSTRTPEQSGAYFGDEKTKLVKMDSTYKVLLKASADYLKAHHVKAKDGMQGMKM